MTTLRDLRRSIATRLNDYLQLTATTVGSTTTFVDQLNLIDPQNVYSGSWGKVVSASDPLNVGEIFRVVASNGTNGVIQFQPPLPGATAVGDVVDLYNLAGKGFAIQIYDQAILDCLQDSFPEYVDLVSQSATIGDSGEIDGPAGWYFIYDIKHYDDYYDGFRSISRLHWGCDIPNAKIMLSGTGRMRCEDSSEVVIYGGKMPSLPDSDSDPYGVPAEWVKYSVAAALGARKISHREFIDASRDWQNMANALRPRIVEQPMPLVRLRW